MSSPQVMRYTPDSKSLFGSGSTLHFKLIFCLIASIGFLAFENREASTAQRVPFAALVEPVRQLVSGPASIFQKLSDWSTSQRDLVAENRRLREEALLLQGKQLRFEALEQENNRLRGLLDSTFKVGDQVLIAEPLLINIVPYENLLVVNKGERHGVKAGQAVVDGKGLVGQVLRVTGRTSDIVMITDPSHATPVQINRTGLRTIAVGNGRTDRLDLPYLPGNADIEPGDLLVTSGLDGVFPAGYPVAQIIARPEGDPSATRTLAVPVARLDHNREVLIVRTDTTPLLRVPDKSESPGAESAAPHD
jgi:rod shape-determining protein MreC